MTGEPDEEILWLAWRMEDDGRVETRITLSREGELVRERRDYGSVGEAAAALGASFREVAERVLESGGRRGRWRP